MKQIKVNQKCSGCGLCVMNSSYLQEDMEGNAVPVPGLAIKDADLEAVERLVRECPEGALQIVETGAAARSGTAGVHDIIADLNRKCAQLSVKQIAPSEVKLNAKNYAVSIPGSSKEYLRNYPSESAARSAARDEFSQLCYSESAYRPLLKKVFVEYKVHVLKPYYTCKDVPESAYYKYNEQVRAYLADAYAEICQLTGEGRLPESWKDFSLYLPEKEWSIEALRNFDDRSTSSGIIAALKDLSHTSLNDYVSEMDFDYEETYAGEGLFGKTKYKNMWYFSGFSDAAKSFMDDLFWAIDYMSDEIEEAAADTVNAALKTYEEKLKKEFELKISQLQRLVS